MRWFSASLLIVGVLGVGNALAFQSNWERESLEFTSNSGTFNCSGCHSPITKANSLVVNAPASVAHDAVQASVSLSGFTSGDKLSSFRYQIDGGPTVNPINNVRGGGSQTVRFNLSDSPVVIRYCLVDANGNARRWNCGTTQMTRDARPNEGPSITSTEPSNRTVQVGDSPFNFRVTATDDTSTPTISVTSSNNSVVAVSSSNARDFTLSFVSAGQSTITITARDAQGETDTQSFRVTVNPAASQNQPPVITSSQPSNRTAKVGDSAFTFRVTATDDSSTPKLAVSSSNTAAVEVDSSAAPEFKLSFVGEGQSTVTITAEDDDGEVDRQAFKITVEPADTPSNPPTLIVVDFEGVLALKMGESRSLPVNEFFVGQGAQAFSVSSSNPAVASGSYLSSFASGGNLRVNATGVGRASITISVTGTSLVKPSSTIEVEVSRDNSAPVANPDVFVVDEQFADVALPVLSNDKDPDGDAVSVVLDANTSSQGNAISVTGATVSIRIENALSSDDFFSYRARDTLGALSDSVLVTLAPSDTDNDGTVDALDNCPVLANADQSDIDSDSLGDLCDIDPDGDGFPGYSGVPLNSGQDLVESECLTCHLVASTGAPLIQDTAAWDARINAAGGQPEDLLDSVLNGRGSMPAFADQYSTQELIEAILYLSGRESTEPEQPGTVVDLDQDEVPDETDNCPEVPNASQSDEDGNGVGDACEPLADRDGDGFPFSTDDDDGNANRLVATLPVVANVSNTTVFTSEQALKLGRVALVKAQSINFASTSAIVSQAEFAQLAAQVLPGITVASDAQYNTLMGIINVSVTSANGVSEVIIKLNANLPLNPVLRILDSGSGAWGDFLTGAVDRVYSAPETSTGCPASGSANYKEGLSAGIKCIRLVLSDGGQNDGDGSANGLAELFANIASRKLDDASSQPETVDTSPAKGGGSSGPLIVLLLMIGAVLRSGSILRKRV